MGLGLTVVVSPLLSLMQDQVRALVALPAGGGVPATFLSSQQSAAEATAVRRELRKAAPSCKLLYVTPEQLVKSGALGEALGALHARGRLARIVIDEAHCVSQWCVAVTSHTRGAPPRAGRPPASPPCRCCLARALLPSPTHAHAHARARPLTQTHPGATTSGRTTRRWASCGGPTPGCRSWR